MNYPTLPFCRSKILITTFMLTRNYTPENEGKKENIDTNDVDNF